MCRFYFVRLAGSCDALPSGQAINRAKLLDLDSASSNCAVYTATDNISSGNRRVPQRYDLSLQISYTALTCLYCASVWMLVLCNSKTIFVGSDIGISGGA